MAPANQNKRNKRQQKKKKKNPPQTLHSTYQNWIKNVKKKSQELSDLYGVKVLLVPVPMIPLAALPMNLSTTPSGQPNPAPPQRRPITVGEEIAALDRMLDRVRERVIFLQSQKNARKNSSDQEADLPSSNPNPEGDATAN